jgi:5-methylcytosine-specific restriction endonuclease McrA
VQPTENAEQWALPLVCGDRIEIPYKTAIVATTDPAKPTLMGSTTRAPIVAITKQPDGTEWVWWSATGGFLRAAVLVNGRLPVIVYKDPRKRPLPSRWCRRCDKKLDPKAQWNAKYCPEPCREIIRKAKSAASRARKKRCPVKGCRRLGFCLKHYPKGYKRRAEYWGVPHEPIVRTEVFDRDGWMCGLCSLPVDPTLQKPDLMRVSLDHIVPLSLGGGHLWDNVQCSHLICNIRKSNRVSL